MSEPAAPATTAGAAPPPLGDAPLPDSALPAAVQRVVSAQAPGPMRQMAARGLAPLPPPDLALCLYQLAHGPDEALRTVARETAGRLPEPVLRGALSAALDPRVLDFLARRLHHSGFAVALLLDNRALHDRTAEFLAAAGDEAAVEQLAKDEVRLLRAPAIIAAMYLNPRARASTALRAVELAAHNGVTVDIPGFDEVVASLRGVQISPEDDRRFAEVVPPGPGERAPDGSLPDDNKIGQEDIERTQAEEEGRKAEPVPDAEQKKKRFEDLPVPLQIRAATIGNAFERSVAIRSTIRSVAMAAVRSPAISPPEVIKYAANRALHEDVIRFISNRREWTQLNSVRLALINNNKCPLGTSMRLLNFLHLRDLKGLSRSKNVPSPLVQAARELLNKRERRS